MKWQVRHNGRFLGTLHAENHAAAVVEARRKYGYSERRLTVEPATEVGKMHDSRFYTGSGPVLTEEDL